ncbi:MAG: NAD(+) synthase [Acholeplasmataceae bacterium]|nr:NAD(+) synthase [Acholeplasmataceae bacterium]
MYHQGFLKVAAATPAITAGDIGGNLDVIRDVLSTTDAAIVVFPELSITGYTASDLFYQASFVRQAKDALKTLVETTAYQGIFIVGLPLDVDGILYNVAAVCMKDRILGLVPKHYLPNNHEFYEMRWFTSANQATFDIVSMFGQEIPFGHLIFEDEDKDIRIAVEICQDLWIAYSPADDMSLAGANVVFNLSASTEHIGKPRQRRHVVLDHSRKQMGAYVYTSSGQFESTSEIVFSAHKIIAVQGELMRESLDFHQTSALVVADLDMDMINFQKRQDTTYRSMKGMQRQTYRRVSMTIKETPKYAFESVLDKYPFVPKKTSDLEYAATLQAQALARRIMTMPKTSRNIIIGISGGLDSTLALLVAVMAVDLLGHKRTSVIGVTMPSKPTTDQSLARAQDMMAALGVTAMTIPIQAAVDVHLDDINHKTKDVTYENAQARMRTMILMDLSNKHHGFVLGTGDMSEIALGWMTYNGDQMSMYGINAGVPKTLVKALIRHHAAHGFKALQDLLNAVLDAPISPELLEDQKTESVIGPYDQNDFIMYHHLQGGASEAKCQMLLKYAFGLDDNKAKTQTTLFFKRFYTQQYKRATLPEGPKIVSFGLSPRSDFRLPSDVKRT